MGASHTPNANSDGPHVIYNPISGEKIIVRTSGAETNGELLVFDLFLPPGKQVPSRHAHPHMEESFYILQRAMLFKLGRTTLLAHPGETVTAAAPRGSSGAAAGWQQRCRPRGAGCS